MVYSIVTKENWFVNTNFLGALLLEYILFVSNLFSPSGFADWTRPTGLKIGIASNFLNLTQVLGVTQNPIYLQASNQIMFVDQANQRNIVISVSNFINFQQDVERPNFQIATNFLFMTQAARTVLWEQIQQQIAFLQDAEVSNGISNSLGLTQTVGLNIVKNLSVGNTLAMNSSASIYKENNPDLVICGS